jgi:oligosaccharide repeat unit polymerase
VSSSAQSVSIVLPRPWTIPVPAIEVILLFAAVGIAAIAFMAHWLSPNQCVVLNALLLVLLLVLSWRNFNQGRHPCFLFMGMLLLCQGGRFLTYSLGSEPDPMRVRIETRIPFDLSRDQQGVVLLCIALSAICIYSVCRLNFRRIGIPDPASTLQYLSYLYLLFYLSVPVQIFKNYNYYQYAQAHGGYMYFWVNHGEFAATVPFWVRLVSLLTLPSFVGIFLLEKRKKYLYLATACYFLSSLLLMLMGSRMGTLGLIVGLWYAAGIKSGKKTNTGAILVLACGLFLVAGVFQALREDTDSVAAYAVDPLKFVTLSGNSLDVTEVVVKYRSLFTPYAPTYMWNELTFAFSPHDLQHYFRGRELGHDVSVLLDASAFDMGLGTAGSYIAEEYMIGGIAGVVLISLLIGCLLHVLYRMSQHVLSLFMVVILLPDILAMPRGDLLDWLSVLAKTMLFLAVLWLGWKLYSILLWLKEAPRPAHNWAAESVSGTR